MSIIVTEEDLCKKHVTKCALFCQYAILPPKQCPAAVQDTLQTKPKHHICAYNSNTRTGFHLHKKIWGSGVLSSDLVTRRKLSLKFTGYCGQSSYTDSEVVFTLLPAVAWVLKSQFAPGYMHLNICFEGVSGKRGIFLNGKQAIEVFFLSRPAIDFSY